MKNYLIALALAAALLILPACGLLDPQAQQGLIAWADQMYQSGAMTNEQYDALIQTILSEQQSFDWNAVISGGVAAALAYFGIAIKPPVNSIQKAMAKKAT